MQSVRITSRPPSRIRKWNQLNQINIYLSNTYRKDWLHVDDEARVQERHQRRIYSPKRPFLYFIWHFQVATRSTNPDMTAVSHVKLYGRFTEIESNLRIKKPPRPNQGSNFLASSFRNRDNVRAPIWLRRERQL